MTDERGLPMLNAWPTASGRSRQASTPLTMSVDVAPGADLRAVAAHGQVAAAERGLDERADRAAADLARAEDVERVDGDGRQLQLVVVGVRHVLAGELRDGVRPARLADRADRRDLALADVVGVGAEDLARREVDEALERVLRRERRLERVVGADHVHAHRPHRALEHGLDAGDRGAVDEVRRAAGELREPRAVEDVAWWSVKFGWSASSVPASASRWRLSTATISLSLDELARERRRDEAGAAGDRGSAFPASATRRSLDWPYGGRARRTTSIGAL